MEMRITARNKINGTVVEVKSGTVHSEVKFRTAEGMVLVSMITREACEELEIAEGKEVTAIIQAPSIMLAVE